MTNIIASPIQNGSVTHHHDQLITCVSLSTTKATPNKPHTPMLELLFASAITFPLPRLARFRWLEPAVIGLLFDIYAP
jgi:hypothetical protein